MQPVTPFTLTLLLCTASLAQAAAPPARGDLRDRHGVVLASDAPAPDDAADGPSQRHYPFGSLASHVLGMVTPSGPNGQPSGSAGVEKMLNDELSPSLATEDTPAHRGIDVTLSLDARHQFIVERALRDAKVGRGTAVLTNVNSGAVLAMASVPSYDLNHFVPKIIEEQFQAYRDNPAVPFLDRATHPSAPGSSFMLVTGLAAAMCGHAGDVHPCDGVFQAGTKGLTCWIQSKGGTHGRQTLDQAMENGCGLYFYGLTLSMGYDKIERFVDLTGLRAKPGTGLAGEGSGFVPGPEWIERELSEGRSVSKPSWTDASSASISVGSGQVNITPLHMTTIAATIANGGTVWKPSLIDHVGDQETKLYRYTPPTKITDLKEHGLSEQGLAVLREGIRKRTAKVTANATPGAPEINGFTGTLVEYRRHSGQKEYVRERNCWYVCYAPADKPRWALTVLVQHGRSGGDTAAPIAHRILQQVAAVEAGTLKVEMKPLPPVQGHFDMVDGLGTAEE